MIFASLDLLWLFTTQLLGNCLQLSQTVKTTGNLPERPKRLKEETLSHRLFLFFCIALQDPKHFRREILPLRYLHFIGEESEIQSSFDLFQVTAILVLGLPAKPLTRFLV